MLHLNDEQAVQYIQGLIDDSVNAFMPTLMEYGHKVAQVQPVIIVISGTVCLNKCHLRYTIL